MNGLFFINMGRWAERVVGPFFRWEHANAYIDGLDWRGKRPTIVTVEEPDVYLLQSAREATAS